jgi:hypothetical protein
MTASSISTATASATAPTDPREAGHSADARRLSTRVLPMVAGAALVAAPVLWSLGMFTSPPQDSMADADYIASLARDTTLTQVSALFLHYGNLAIALGILAAPALVRGARGAWAAVVGAILTSIGFANVSGLLLSDWFNASTGRLLTSEQAVAVFQGVKEASLFWLWDGTEPLSLVGPLVLLVGLARAGVLGWWSIALLVAGVVGIMVFAASAPVLIGAVVLVAFSPFALIGLRLLQRSRLARS